MIKEDLLKLVEALGDKDDVNETLKAIEEFKIGSAESIDLTKLTIDDYKNILENNATIKGYNQSNLDSAISIAINSHDKKFAAEKLPKLIDDALKAKSNEGKTEIEIKFEEMQKEMENMKNEKTKAEMSSKYTKVLGEKGLPIELINYVLGADDETTTANIEQIGTLFTSAIQANTKNLVNGSGYVPPAGTPGDKGAVTKEQFKKMSYADRNKLFKENKDLYTSLNEGEI